MSSNHTTENLEAFAEEFAGNWRKFHCFVWHDAPEENPGDWGIYYTYHEGSRTLERVNAEVIAKTFQPYLDADPDCEWIFEEVDRHPLVHRIYGYAIRVYDDEGNITDAARTLYAIECRRADYPSLDDDRLSELEYSEQWDAWESGGQQDLREELESRWYSLGDAAGSSVDLSFEHVPDDTLDAILQFYNLDRHWEHNGESPDLNIEAMADTIHALPLDTIINWFFADLDAYQDRHTGTLFEVVQAAV